MKNDWDFPVAIKPLRGEIEIDEMKIRFPDERYIIFNELTGESYAIVSGKYCLIPHSFVLEIARTMLRDITKDEIIKVEKNGAYMFTYYPLWKFDVNQASKGDIVEMGIRLINSYDGMKALTVEIAGLRLSCKNGITIPISRNIAYRKTHIGVNNEEMKMIISNAITGISAEIDAVRQTLAMSQIERYTLSVVEKLIEGIAIPRCYRERALKGLTDGKNVGEWESEGFTRWEVFNALTFAISHYNENKSLFTKRRYEREAFCVLKGKEVGQTKFKVVENKPLSD